VTALALMTTDARGFGPLKSARRVTLAVTQPVRDGVEWAVSPLNDGWRGAVHYTELEEENALLRQRLAELEGEIDRLPNTELELKQILAATELEYLGDVPQVTARVVADRHTGLERIIEINRGSDVSIEEDMPVVTGEGLLGRVVLTTGNRSVIRLITDPRFRVGVIDPVSGAIGVATGDGDGDSLVLDLEEGSLDLAFAGARFETSGFDRSRYPGGIPVGELIVDEDGDVRVLVPSADVERVAYLTVLLVGEPR
jgi:rod shape-determining protein MreC